jgi:predicted lipid-binding transport protein (Tim44 family)
MATILAGRFETISPAERAARALLRSGFAHDDVSIFHVNAPGQHHVLALGGDEAADPESRPARQTSILGAALGALVLGLLGWLAGKYVAPLWGPLVGVLGAFVGAYLGSLYGTIAGLSWKATRNRRHRPAADDSAYAPRKAGIVVAVNLRDAGRSDRAGAALRTLGVLGARDIELAEGEWDDGWTDFDPVREPRRVAEGVAAGRRR